MTIHLRRRCAGYLALLVLWSAPGGTLAQVAAPSPFEPVTDHLITGDRFWLELLPTGGNFRPDVTAIRLQRSCSTALEQSPAVVELTSYKTRLVESSAFLIVRTPTIEALERVLGPELRAACLTLDYSLGDQPFSETFQLIVPSKTTAYVLSVGFMLVLFLLIGLLKPQPLKQMNAFKADHCSAQWEQSYSRIGRVLRTPMSFAITPMGTYSISLMQALLWTYLTIFMSVYIYYLHGTLLDVTPQMLTMLGIGGGTAVVSKLNAVSRANVLPPMYLKLIERWRIPRLRDLISTDDRPNLFKFQILAFTVIAGGFVLIETLKVYEIPIIPDSLVVLMGLSSAVYLSNEVGAENVWKRIDELRQQIEKHPAATTGLTTVEDLERVRNHDASGRELVEEISARLQAIYA